MADNVWGQMPKSAEDPEKIEEAIDRLIAEHEADPQAHLGAGESLETHRANETIDHPAESIVADKFSSNLMLDGKYVIGFFDKNDDTGVSTLYQDLWNINNYSQSSYIGSIQPNYFCSTGGTLDITAVFRIQKQTADSALIGFTYDYAEPKVGIFFESDGNDIYIRYYDQDQNIVGESLLYTGTNFLSTCHLQWNDVDQMFRFWLHDELKLELTFAEMNNDNLLSDGEFCYSELTRSGTSHTCNIQVFDWRASYQITF